MTGSQGAVDSRLGAGDPRRIGPYRLVARLGRGGMGQVYLARSPGGRPVAVKVIAPELASDPEFRRRFADEVKAARRVGGFYTAQVVDAGLQDVQPWLATAYIPGPSLEQAVQAHGPLPPEALPPLGSGLAEGLAAIHRRDLVHRDLKPGNVIIGDDGPRVIDFGISRALDGSAATRSILGTPGYMSPEQCLEQETGPAADVFALGCVLVYAVSGRSPYGQGDALSLQYRTVHGEPDLSSVPKELRPFLAQCLDREPGRRPTVEAALATFTTPGGDASWLPAGVSSMIHQRRIQAAALPPAEASGRAGGRGRALVLAAAGVLLAGVGASIAAAVWPDSPSRGTASAADRSMNPCDVLDNTIAQNYRLTDTGSPGGYESGPQQVRTCKWATADFGGPDPNAGYKGYYLLAYGPTSLELVQTGRHHYPADLDGLPGAQAYANASEYPSACEVTWATSFGRVVVYASGDTDCGNVARFAKSVFPKAPT